MSRTSKERRYSSVREMAEKRSMGFSATYLKLPEKVHMFKPKEGAMQLDIIPFVAGENNPNAKEGQLHWERTYFVHRGIGANSDTYICPRMNSKSKCPICEYRAKLAKEGDESKEELVQDLAPKERQLINVIDLKAPEKGIQIWDISYHLFGKALIQRIRNSDEDDGWDNFYSLEDGLTLKIGFAEKSYGGRSFQETASIDFKPRKEPYDEDKVEEATVLDEVLVEMDYEDLKKVFLEAADVKSKKSKADEDEEDEDEDEDEEDESSKSKSTTGKGSKKLAQDEEDDDEAEEDEEEDEDEAPPKKKKRPAQDEEEDEEDEEEDEDEAPPKKKKRVKEDDEDDDADDEEEEKPRVKTLKEEEDEDEEDEAPPKKKKRPAADEEDEDEAPPKKKKETASEDEEDDDWNGFKKKKK